MNTLLPSGLRHFWPSSSRVSAIRAIIAIAVCVAWNGSARVRADELDADASELPKRLSSQHLANPIQVHAKVISGGTPNSDAAFEELDRLGVNTIISVDGAKPDLKTASKYGLRYVHLPHGYDRVPAARVKELAKAVLVFEGPIYFHCHHGQHRGPTAASVACVSAGLIPPASGLAVLELAGTSDEYRGLYDSVRRAHRIDASLLDKLDVRFHESVNVPPLTEAMVEIHRSYEHLQLIADSGWQTPRGHPGLEPAHEALIMREQFTELLRADLLQREDDDFKQHLRDSADSARALEEAIRRWQPTSTESPPPAKLTKITNQLKSNCTACHRQFR